MQWLLLYTSVTVFYWKNKYAKVLNGTSIGRLRDPLAGRRLYMFFKFNSETYLTYFDRLLETL